jgi:hypothetical protein
MSDSAVDLLTAGMNLLTALVQAGIITPQSLHGGAERLTRVPPAVVGQPAGTYGGGPSAQVVTVIDQDLRTVLAVTPGITVLTSQGSCAGANTVRVRYKIDSSTDCVDLNAGSIVQLEDAKLLFIGTVDGARNQNNAIIYEFAPSARFLGTSTASGHRQFHLSYDGSRVFQTYLEKDGTVKNCYIVWTNESLGGNCS